MIFQSLADFLLYLMHHISFAPPNKTFYSAFLMSNSTAQYQVPALNDIIHVIEIYSIGDGIH